MNEDKKASGKPWGGRFLEATEKMLERFSASVHYDCRLYRQDIAGSKVHARMLAKQGIISDKDAKAIIKGLGEIEEEIASGDFVWNHELEDVHMNIEQALVERIGKAGKRLGALIRASRTRRNLQKQQRDSEPQAEPSDLGGELPHGAKASHHFRLCLCLDRAC